MNRASSKIYLARHGETEWSIAGRHTSVTDLPLTADGEQNARQLGERLKGLSFTAVFTSPLIRAQRTAALAGFADRLTLDAEMTEWNYGDYEGRRTSEIQQERPGWNLFHDGCPGGETAGQVGVRADRVIARLREQYGDVLLFGHRHFLSVLAARWVRLPAGEGRIFDLDAGALSILGYHYTIEDPVIRLWNDRR